MTFAVAATGAGSLAYQWSFNGKVLPGMTNSALVIDAAQASDAGSYTVVVSDAANFVQSSAASLSLSQSGLKAHARLVTLTT